MGAEDRIDPGRSGSSKSSRRKFLGILAGLPGALGLGWLIGQGGDATASDAAKTPVPARKKGNSRSGQGLTGRARDRLLELSNLKLPPEVDVEQLSREDILRIVDLVRQGVPLRHEVRANEPLDPMMADFGRCHPYAAFSSGENCEGQPGEPGYGCNNFECSGSIFDDFECTLTFLCDVYHCEYSFDDSDCMRAGHSVFMCNAQFTDDDGPGFRGPEGIMSKLDDGRSPGISLS